MKQQIQFIITVEVDADQVSRLAGYQGTNGDPSDIDPPIPGIELEAIVIRQELGRVTLAALPERLDARIIRTDHSIGIPFEISNDEAF